MKELTSLTLHITVATSQLPAGGGRRHRLIPKLCFGLVWKSTGRLGPK